MSRGVLSENWASWAVLAAVALVFLTVSSNVRQGIRQQADERFDAIAVDVAHGVRDQFNAYTGVLIGVRALFAAKRGDVTGREFKGYVESLGLKDAYPGFEVLNFAARVTRGNKQAFEQRMRQDEVLKQQTMRPFAIHPPGDRHEYFPITYIEPLTAAGQIGFDLGALPEGIETLQRARSTGELLSSGRVRRVSGIAFVSLRLPVYRGGAPARTPDERRAAYVGSVGAGISLEGLLRSVIAGRESVHLRLYDGGPTPPPDGPDGAKIALSPQMGGHLADGPAPEELKAPELVWDSQANVPPRRGIERVLRFEFAGRKWDVRVSVDERDMISPLEHRLPVLILVSGVLLIALLLVIQRVLTRRSD